MNKKDQIITKISELGGSISGNIYLQGVSEGIMGLLPIIIVGAFANLFKGLPIPLWQNVLASTGINHLLNMVGLATTNMLGIYFVYNIARSLAKKLNVEGTLVPVLAIVMYLILLPETVMKGKNPVAFLSYDYLGTQGMIVAIIIGILIVKIYQAILNANLVVKMPEGTPEYVSKSFSALIPSFIIVVITMLIRFLFKLTPYGNVFDCIYKILQMPLTDLLGGSLLPMCILQLLNSVLWILGIHPGFILSLTAPILFGLDFKNQAAFATGKAVPSIIGMAFSYSTTIAVFLYSLWYCRIVIW
ncbi:PTS transporter subunit EIIC [Sharpea azabuensis]|uniref:PTS system, cellobiose-specific IIC component n=1 Tax=Sharpea azabuensis TaxID=322505 RepID=A0A1H6XQJ9_9FIRM|nr:PTS transporter subunit EIIC [Sharpea azabuensis]SEJ27162.1 PTS system, cellobiose-specific IIC component [Sharpea azabuensis]